MVDQPHPQLLRAVQERDRERERQERIRFQRIAGVLRLQNERLQRQVQQLTMDRANLANAVTRAKRT
jgi:hypothetical protein